MTSRRSFITYLLTLFSLGATLAAAQQAPTSTETDSSATGDSLFSDWAHSFSTFNHWGSKLYVVTVDHPGHRYPCQVQSADAAGITCAASGLHSARTIASARIAAIISPGHHSDFLRWFGGLVAVGGCLVAAAFIAPISLGIAVPLGIVGGFALLLSPFTALFADEDEDHHEGVLYQRPNTPLTVHLH